MIDRACGYAPGEWDGFDLQINDDTLTCTNGRRVNDPEVRRVLRQAAPQIDRSVSAAMETPEVVAALDRVTAEATNAALAQLAAE